MAGTQYSGNSCSISIDGSSEMGSATGGVGNHDGPAGFSGPTVEGNRRREEQRRFELDSGCHRIRQATLERREAAGFQPHAVGDGAPKTEQSRGQRVEVDRVDVAGDGGVATTDISRDAPDGGWYGAPTLPSPASGGGGCVVAGGRLRGQPVAVGGDVGELNGRLGQPVGAAASSSSDGFGVETSQAGRLVELDCHAPRTPWPQTRITWPLTPAVPGWPSQATVSATSTGRPPWFRLLIRRPISRVAKGMAFVMAVSMNPGATALMVMSRSAITGASAWTMPMMPALLAA